jgi:hypothetical protein
VLAAEKKDVDARHKAGHDDGGESASHKQLIQFGKYPLSHFILTL